MFRIFAIDPEAGLVQFDVLDDKELYDVKNILGTYMIHWYEIPSYVEEVVAHES